LGDAEWFAQTVGGPRPTPRGANRQSSIRNHQSQAVYEYDVYGQVAASDPNHPNRFMFTGREFDKETGLYYYRARYYNASIGRFLQTDPIGYQGGVNLYSYCLNNPLGMTDASGCDPCDPCDLENLSGYVMDGDTLWAITGDWNLEGICFCFNVEPGGVTKFAYPNDVPIYVIDRENYEYVRWQPADGNPVMHGRHLIADWGTDPTVEDTGPPAGDSDGGGIGVTPPLQSPWSVFWGEYSHACYGVVNAMLGGLFETESGIPYMISSAVRDWSTGESFKSGETGWQIAETALITAAGLRIAGVDPWIGTAGLHGPHHGMGYHFEIILRGPSGTNLKVIMPGTSDWIFIGFK